MAPCLLPLEGVAKQLAGRTDLAKLFARAGGTGLSGLIYALKLRGTGLPYIG
jgi:hypothetical protein